MFSTAIISLVRKNMALCGNGLNISKTQRYTKLVIQAFTGFVKSDPNLICIKYC